MKKTNNPAPSTTSPFGTLSPKLESKSVCESQATMLEYVSVTLGTTVVDTGVVAVVGVVVACCAAAAAAACCAAVCNCVADCPTLYGVPVLTHVPAVWLYSQTDPSLFTKN